MIQYTYSQLADYLHERLTDVLPGEAAQQKMASSLRNAGQLNFKTDGKTRQGAVCILFYQKQGIWHLPLIVRPEYDGTHSGQVAFPGGKVEETDPTYVATALREMHEEIGVPTDSVQILGALTPLLVIASNFMVHPFVGITSEAPVFIPDSREVAKIIEVPLPDLLDDNRRSAKEIQVRGFSLWAPYFDLEGQTVWGATAMMLSELIEVLKKDT
ncbi:CoA pyrophosphatase [Cytophagaceae bacterium DM2B3-1]|uniref:CoA pyrophosphatase n=1 Tax=Xanthocytophaga flava TaxID=3048013 RepID=A0ABT7CSV1_9BACT|nr:CoA pyrophosphatase [Xanthocytophaga flavus]MDJ1471912.1 CoA pyrophosphatase [Xanthocytophaga flavus]MDJ1496848.1 CoA pyrophosphatase [Xanthocytophaga flavus]